MHMVMIETGLRPSRRAGFPLAEGAVLAAAVREGMDRSIASARSIALLKWSVEVEGVAARPGRPTPIDASPMPSGAPPRTVDRFIIEHKALQRAGVGD